jgi:hypothetical protein
MKQIFILGLVGILVGVLPACRRQPQAETLPAAGGDPKDTLVTAAMQLGEKANYSWSASTREAGGGLGAMGALGPIEGKVAKDGLTHLSFSIGDILIEVYRNGPKGAAQVMGGWRTLDDIARMGDTPAEVVRYVRGYQAPAAESARLAGNVTDLMESDGALSGGLKEDAVKELLLIGARNRQGKAPEAADAKGSVRFWIKNGLLTRYEISVQGKVTEGDRESAIQRTTTVEIKNAGSTKLEAPPEAKQKMT